MRKPTRSPTANANALPQLPPHSPEAEESVIGSILIDPVCLPAIARIISDKDFFIVKLGWIYALLIELWQQKTPIDFVTVCDALEKREQLKEVGGSAYISHLSAVVPTAMHADGYARIVKRDSTRRQMLALASSIAEDAYADRDDVFQSLDKALNRATAIKIESSASLNGHIKLLSAADILTTQYPEIYYAVPGLLPAGLTFLAGKPKVGKSWLAMQIACAVASGGIVMNMRANPGRVLYLALEDTQRRLCNRMKKQQWPNNLPVDFITLETFGDEIGDMTAGGGDRIAHMIQSAGYKLVVIDTFSKAIGMYMQGDQQNNASAITRALSPLQRMAGMENCAVVMIDHHSKAAGNALTQDAVTDILGSVSKGGVLDCSWGLYKERGKFGAKLQIVGRDIEEDKLFQVSFDRQLGIWCFDGDATDLAMTQRRDEILRALEANGKSTLTAISDFVNQPRGHTYERLQDLVNAGHVTRSQTKNDIYYELAQLK